MANHSFKKNSNGFQAVCNRLNRKRATTVTAAAAAMHVTSPSIAQVSLCHFVWVLLQIGFINNCYRGDNNTLGRSSFSTLTTGLCSTLLMSIDAVLARRDWLEFMEGVAAVWVMAGSKGGGGGWGMEAFGFSRPLGLSIMAWILSSADTKIISGGKFQITSAILFVLHWWLAALERSLLCII